MEVLIIEDEILAVERLEAMLKRYDPDIKVLDSVDSVEEAEKWFLKNKAPDLVLMDIHLSDGLSFEIFKKVKFDSTVIFTTAYDQYAIKAFRVNSIDYLLKPISFTELSDAIEKLKSTFYKRAFYKYEDLVEITRSLQYLKKDFKSRFLVKYGDHLLYKSIEETAYFFAEGKYVYLVEQDRKKFLIDYTLEELEGLLDPVVFFRVNRKYLIKINAIKDIRIKSHGRLCLFLQPGTEEEVIISREKASDFKSWIDK